jgi:transcriptional regulator with XRE-family HTH domain
MGVGKNLLLLRTAKGLTQIELAARLDIENYLLSRIEKEKELPYKEVVQKAASIFDVRYEDLAYGTYIVRLQTECEEEAADDAGEDASVD